MPGTTLYIIGQALSVVAVLLGFATFQMKTVGRVLAMQIATASVFAAHYLLIGAYTAMGLNLLAAVKCVCYYIRDKRGDKSPVFPIVFTVLVLVTGVLTWSGWYSAFIVLGLMVNSVALALSDPQKIRYAMFVKSPCCLVYNVLAGSLGGTIYEGASLLSSVIGTVKNVRKEKKNGKI